MLEQHEEEVMYTLLVWDLKFVVGHVCFTQLVSVYVEVLL